MSKDLNQEKSQKMTKVEISREEKKRLRREAITDKNTLAMDESLKQPGMKYRLCNVTPGNIENWKKRGYEVVQAPIHAGTGDLGEAKSAHGSIEVEVGRTSSLKAVWMETSDENYDLLREIDADNAKSQEDMIFDSEIPQDAQIGKITKDYN